MTAEQLKHSEVLSKAADLIEPEGAWTQGAQARNKRGQRVADSAKNAVCFCASGAIWRAARKAGVAGLSSSGGSIINDAHVALSTVINGRSLSARIPDWNDAPERTQAEVVAALRQAAAKAREAGQ